MSQAICFLIGAMAGVIIMCILQVNRK
ncbi:MAG: DUF3789 domain-containing protein [Lachnospiraceae bacterium]|nr:DUF3789 domain-containing protein [Lachnospiraceae bacterium]